MSGIKISEEFVKRFGKKYPPESTLAREGEAGNTMFVIYSGKVAILKSTAAGEKQIATLSTGNFFGEMSIVGSNDKRGATVKTLVETMVLELNRDAFEALIKRSPEIAMEVIKTLADRLRDVNGRASALIHKDDTIRIAQYFFNLTNVANPAPGQASGVCFTFKPEAVANALGLTPQAVNGFLSVAQKAKILGRNGDWLWAPFPQYILPFGQLVSPMLKGAS